MDKAIKGIVIVTGIILAFMLGYATAPRPEPVELAYAQVKMLPLPPKAVERAVIHIDPGWQPFAVTDTHIILRK